MAHFLCEIADALGGRPMVWCLRREPLTRRLTAGGATLSHRGPTGGEGRSGDCLELFTPASASVRRARLWIPFLALASASPDRPIWAPRPRPRSGRAFA